MGFFRWIYFFYYDGFRKMTIGKNLWLIIIIKLFIIFAVFRMFFFRDFLDKKFENQKDKSEYVIDELTNRQP